MPIVHFQLNTQTTRDINLIGLKRDALDKLLQNMPVIEFKEAWHSMDKLTFNRHIDIPTIYLQLQHPRKSSSLSSLTFNPPTTSLPTSTDDDNNYLRTIATNDSHRREIPQPIRRSHRLQHRQQERENSNILTF